MTRAELLQRIDDLGVWRRRGQRAPHKPLLLLYALGRLERGETRYVPYRDVDEPLRRLLQDFGPPRRSYHSEYPFWWLRSDGIWEVAEKAPLPRRSGNKEPSRRALLAQGVEGGFTAPVQKLFGRNPELRREVAQRVLAAHFPESLHAEILSRVGLDLSVEPGKAPARRPRDPRFRDLILRAYEHRCAVCGFGVRLGQEDLCLEAAHIRWHQADGPDTEQNGLALCVMHHKMLDRGAFTAARNYRIEVSAEVHGESAPGKWLLAYHGRLLRPPQDQSLRPALEHLAWHRREVFREPARGKRI